MTSLRRSRVIQQLKNAVYSNLRAPSSPNLSETRFSQQEASPELPISVRRKALALPHAAAGAKAHDSPISNMKALHLFLLLAVVFAFACDRQKTVDSSARVEDPAIEAQRRADEERIAELRDLEQRVAEREAAARAAETAAEREAIQAERAVLDRERVKLVDAQKKAAEAQRTAAARAANEAKQTARQEQQIDFFYEPLDPHGEWLELEKHGYVWQPASAATRGWRPYTDGRWVWTDYGWTWSSNEPFGWAVYHYGRWTRLKRLGWVWVPGSEWAPAWVAWRRGENHVGWAPLPPEAHSGSGFNAAVDSYYDIGPGSYTFVPVESFGEQSYVQRAVAPDQNVTIINQTTNVTNVTYRTVENRTTVYNEGPDIQIIEARSTAPVQRLKVERVTDGRAPRASVQRGGVLEMIAPVIASATQGGKAPAKVKERVQVQEMDRGWEQGADRQEGERIRAKMVAEARNAEAAQRKAPAGNEPARAAAVSAAEASAARTDDPDPSTPAPRRPEPSPVATATKPRVAAPPTPAPTASATPAVTTPSPATPRRPTRVAPTPAPAPTLATPPPVSAEDPAKVVATPTATPATPRARRNAPSPAPADAATPGAPISSTPVPPRSRRATPSPAPAAMTSTPSAEPAPGAASSATPTAAPDETPARRRPAGPRAQRPDPSATPGAGEAATTPAPNATPARPAAEAAAGATPAGEPVATPPVRRGSRPVPQP